MQPSTITTSRLLALAPLPLALAATVPCPQSEGLAGQLLPAARRLSEATLLGLGSDSSPCTATAGLGARASTSTLEAELALQLGAYVNLTDDSEAAASFQAAWQGFQEGLDQVVGQHRARLALCEVLGGGAYDPVIDPEDFVRGVDHPFHPLPPGATWTYHKVTDEGLEVTVVTVTGMTEVLLGVECVVVRATETLEGELLEDTFDYFAQDRQGDVWYFGETSLHFSGGSLSDLEGSWKAGQAGAKPGTAMLADPVVGTTYRKEFLLNHAEDVATVQALGAETVVVPQGTHTFTLQIGDKSPLDDGEDEVKSYAPGVGLVLEVDLLTGERMELVDFTRP